MADGKKPDLRLIAGVVTLATLALAALQTYYSKLGLDAALRAEQQNKRDRDEPDPPPTATPTPIASQPRERHDTVLADGRSGAENSDQDDKVAPPEKQDRPAPEPEVTDVAEAEPPKATVRAKVSPTLPVLPDINLRQRICEAGAISVRFEPQPGDNRRYVALNGAVTLSIEQCDATKGVFHVPALGQYASASFAETGVIARNGLTFRFRYYSLQRFITCSVTASGIVSIPAVGSINCSGSNNEMTPREAIIEF